MQGQYSIDPRAGKASTQVGGAGRAHIVGAAVVNKTPGD